MDALVAGRFREPVLVLGVATYLHANRGRWVSHRELIEWIYGERDDGGPMDVRSCIARKIFALRRRGIEVENFHGYGYRMPL